MYLLTEMKRGAENQISNETTAANRMNYLNHPAGDKRKSRKN